jgi:predicted secreted protein
MNYQDFMNDRGGGVTMEKLRKGKKSMMKLFFVMSVMVLVLVPYHMARADQWSNLYGGSQFDRATSIEQTSDGKYIVAGSSASSGGGDQDLWVAKLDFSGNVEWQKTYGGSKDDVASSIQPTTDGGYIVAGNTASFGAGGKDVWVLKLNSSGGVQWQKTYGGSKDDVASSIQLTADGGYIVAGSTASFGAGGKDIWVLKIDSSGSVQWQKAFGSDGDEDANAVQETSDGGYIVAGWTNSYAGIRKEAWVLKLDANKNIQWQRIYVGIADDIAYSVQETTDEGFIVAGSTTSFGAGKEDGWFLKLDANGNILLQKTFGDSGSDEIFSIRQTLDGGYALAGRSNSFNGGKEGAWVSKVDKDGSISGCQIVGASYAAIYSTIISGIPTYALATDTSVLPQTNPISEVSVEASPTVLCIVSGPDIAVDPLAIDFGSTSMMTSSFKTVTVMNTGSKDLIISDVDITGTNSLDFGIRKDECSNQTLTSSESCTIEVRFSPNSDGTRNATLTIPSNDSDFSNVSVSLTGEGVFPITLKTPANHTSYSACSLYSLPVFSWEIKGTFQRYQLQFSKTTDFSSSPVKVSVTGTETTMKSNTWKQVLSIPGEVGGPVYWRVMGTLTGGKTAFISEYRSITIEPAESVGNAEIASTSKSSFPVLSWENHCNVKFKVWFGGDSEFSNKYSISYTVKNPLDNSGTFTQTVTSRQWDSIRNLVDDQSGSTLYWKVESWDGVNRLATSATLSFILED